MAYDTVSGAVTALVSTFDSGLEYYTKWQRRKWQQNHYETHDKGTLSTSGTCGLSTSLRVASSMLREAYEEGVDEVGDNFVEGDGKPLPVALVQLKLSVLFSIRRTDHLLTPDRNMSRDTPGEFKTPARRYHSSCFRHEVGHRAAGAL